MKLLIVILLINSCCFGQTSFYEMPEGTKKIEFEYESKSNFKVTENGIYADSTLLSIELSNYKIKIKRHPIDSAFTTGFIELNALTFEDKKKLASIIYHSNEIIQGVYEFDKEKAKYTVKRDHYETKKAFKILNVANYESFIYKFEINYKKRKKVISYPTVSYTYPFNDVGFQIEYLNTTNGTFKTKANKSLLQNTIFLNKNLNKYITYDIFTNNNFGVQKTMSIYDTITLNSVKYK